MQVSAGLLTNGIKLDILEQAVTDDVVKQVSDFNRQLYSHVISYLYNTQRFVLLTTTVT